MRSARSRLVVLVAPAGVLAGHGLGYALSGPAGSGAHAVDHHYLPVVVSATVPLLIGALLWAAVRPARSGHAGTPDRAPLALLVVAQWTLFVGQELLEHAAAGDAGSLLHSRALWFGLAAQVAVAAATVLLLSAAGWVGDRAVHALRAAPGGPVPPVPATCPGAFGWWPAAAVLRATITSRGPPPRSC